MTTRRFVFGIVVASILTTGSNVLGQARMFLQTPTAGAVTAPPDGIRIEAYGGDILTFWVMGERSPVNVSGNMATLPCQAFAGDQGGIGFVGPPAVSISNPAYLFYQIGAFPVTDNGNCPAPPPPAPGNPRIATAAGIGVPARPMVAPKYLGEFRYTVSSDARGEFVIDIPNEPDSTLRDGNSMPVLFTTSGATIVVREGQCCVAGACEGVMSWAACDALDGDWRPNRNCNDPCACDSDLACMDNNPCTVDRCVNGVCAPGTAEFGNVDAVGPDHATLDDLLCAIRALSDPGACPNADLYPPCLGDGVIDVLDIIWVLRAFGGEDPCGCTP